MAWTPPRQLASMANHMWLARSLMSKYKASLRVPADLRRYGRQPSRNRPVRRFIGRLLRWGVIVAFFVIIIDTAYLFYLAPDWRALAQGDIPKSSFIKRYEQRLANGEQLPALRWRPVYGQAIPETMKRAVIVAEDSRFFQHRGIDLIAFKEAMLSNLQRGKLQYGASTISQQTIKNLVLSPARDPLRKWHELVLTLWMEMRLDKQRILEIYLNIAEFGSGIYGVEAAAQSYWGIPASAFNIDQAVALAASLPSPSKHNPQTNTRRFNNRVEKIMGWM